MADYKRQHYVPRSYLKRFSPDAIHIGMCLVNTDPRKIFQPDNEKAPRYENECYEDYFYGNDTKIENRLSKIEKDVALLLDGIVANGNISNLETEQIVDLLMYIVLQHTRTQSFAKQLDDSANKMMKVMLPHLTPPPLPAPLTFDDIKFSYDKPGLEGVSLAFTLAVQIHDLKYALLRTSKDSEFITCDAPVALCNQFLGCIPKFACMGFPKTGLAAKGLQIYFPIDSHNLIMLYDGEVYDLELNDCRLKHINATDATNINLLLMKTAERKIYFRTLNPNLERILKNFKHPGHEKAIVEKYTVKLMTIDKTEELIRLASKEMSYSPTLSFVSMTRHAKEFRKIVESPSSMRKSDFLRDHELSRALNSVCREISRGGPHMTETLSMLEEPDLP